MVKVKASTLKNVERVKKSDMNENVHYEMAGIFSSRGEWTHPRRRMSTYEYIFVTQGKAFIEEDGRQFVLRQGELLRLDPELEHFGFQPSLEPVSFIWMHFYGQIDPSRLPKHIKPDCAPRLTVLLHQLLHYANNKNYPKLAADCTVRIILTELCTEFGRLESPTPSLYGRICEWCRTNSDKKLTASEVANHFGYNKDYLNRMFVKFGGKGLKEYINDRRMDGIRSKLLSEGLTLKQIAEASGFEEYKDFLKFFRYHEGITPTEYRNLYYKTHTNNK